jgi:hypothetical protein
MTRLLDKSPTLHDRLKAEEKRLKIELDQVEPGSVREKLLEKLRHLDAAAHINEWLSSPGLRAPT